MMYRILILLLMSVFTFQYAAAQDSEKYSATDAMDNALNRFVRPGYKSLRVNSSEMLRVTKDLCAKADNLALENTQRQFSNLVSAWGGIEMIRFGPILGDNMLERFFFYPDRRSRSLKRINRLLSAKEESALDPEKLTKLSVALQGLTALDIVLYGTGSDVLTKVVQGHRCRYAMSIATNLVAISSELDREWNGEHEFLYLWGKPGYRNPVFANNAAAITHLFSTIVHGLEVVRDLRLTAFLKETAEDDRPKSAPLWRSRNTMRLLLANIKSMEKIYRTSELMHFLSADNKHIAKSADAQFLAIYELINTDLDIAKDLSNIDEREKLSQLHAGIDQLITTFDKRFAGSMGLSVGFFFNDGD